MSETIDYEAMQKELEMLLYLAYLDDFDCSPLLGACDSLEAAQAICQRHSEERLGHLYQALSFYAGDDKEEEDYLYYRKQYDNWQNPLQWEDNKACACTWRNEYGHEIKEPSYTIRVVELNARLR